MWRRSSRYTVEDAISLDTATLRKRFGFDGRRDVLRWYVGGDLHSSSVLTCSRQDVLVEHSGGTQTIPLTWTRCNYGGLRPWFVCKCGRKVRKVYRILSDIFRCRTCHELDYATQRTNRNGRMLIKQQRICEKLGGSYGYFPPRPKRMRKSTYQRFVAQYERALAQDTWLSTMTQRFGIVQ